MKFKNITNWTITDELDGLLFFAQRMDELLWDYTLDTYKPHSLNAPFLCNEAIEVIKHIEEDLIKPDNLTHILEELTWSVQNDKIAKSLMDLPIEYYILHDPSIKISDKKLRLEVLYKSLNPFRYLHECFDSLISQISLKQKKDIDHSARMLITTLLNMGMSKRIIFQKTNDYFFAPDGPKITEPNQIKDFLKSIYPYTHHFEIFFKANNLISEISESIHSFNVKILSELPEKLSETHSGKSFNKNESEVYLHVGGITELDPFTAYEEASNRISMLRDLFTVFHHNGVIQWSEDALIEQCCTDEKVIVHRLDHSMKKAYDLAPNKASKQLNNFIEHEALKGLSFKKFKTVVNLHGMCVTSNIVENQLVNLWTSYETLVPTKGGGSNIQKIIEGMLPFLMMSYIYRIIQTFNHDLIVWNRWKTRNVLSKVKGFEKSPTLHKTLGLLCLDENEHLRDVLYKELKDFHLLRHRAYFLSKLLSDPEEIRAALNAHEKKLKWQIRRIYRSRNLIVHSGNKPTYLHTLVENGHDYLDQMIFGVMKYTCGEYNSNTLEQSFDLAEVQYQKFTKDLSAIKKFTKENCLLLCISNDSTNDITRKAWSPSS